MTTNKFSNRYSSERKKYFFKSKAFILFLGLFLGAGIMIALYKTSVYFSTDESCMMCHVHPHVENSWKLSKHVNNGSGVKTHCVACHLPPQTNTWKHYSAKAKLGMKDVWSYLTKAVRISIGKLSPSWNTPLNISPMNLVRSAIRTYSPKELPMMV